MMRKVLSVLAFLALWSVQSEAQTDCSTISAAAVAAGLTGLTSALDATGLSDTFNVPGDTTTYTVFAPSDDAFTAALTAIGSNGTLTSDQTDQLTQILQAHVVMGAYTGSSLMTQMPTIPTLLDGVNLTSDGSTVTVGDTTANIIEPDAGTALCGGSVVHVIDAVLIPPGVVLDMSPAPPAPPSNCTTIASAAAEANLTTLVTLLTEADLADPFTDSQTTDAYTVFAPTDEAFQTTLTQLGGGNLTSDQLEMVSKVLKAHVVTGAYDAANLTAGGGQDMQTLDEDSQLSSDGMTVMLGTSSANIITPDAAVNLCGGSVVHLIDAVLMPSTDSTGTDMSPQPPLPPGASPRPMPPGTSPAPSPGSSPTSSSSGLFATCAAVLVSLSALLLTVA